MDNYITLAALLRSVDIEQELRVYVEDFEADPSGKRYIIDGSLGEYAPRDWRRPIASDAMIGQACEDYYGARVAFIRTTDDGVLEIEVDEP